MANVEAFIESTLGSAQDELAQAEAINRAEDAEPLALFELGPGTFSAPSGFGAPIRGDLKSVLEREARDLKRLEERAARNMRITELKAQVLLLAQIKDMMGEQHAETTAMLEKQQTENKAHFIAIKQRDDQSTRFSVWLTAGSSAVSLVAGWLLSLASSPISVLHAFTR